jgi:hypothetical protein
MPKMLMALIHQLSTSNSQTTPQATQPKLHQTQNLRPLAHQGRGVLLAKSSLDGRHDIVDRDRLDHPLSVGAPAHMLTV